MRWLKGKTESSYLMISESEEEFELMRWLWNHKVIRDCMGMYKFFNITALTKDLDEAKQLHKHFPNAISAIWLNIRPEQKPVIKE